LRARVRFYRGPIGLGPRRTVPERGGTMEATAGRSVSREGLSRKFWYAVIAVLAAAILSTALAVTTGGTSSVRGGHSAPVTSCFRPSGSTASIC